MLQIQQRRPLISQPDGVSVSVRSDNGQFPIPHAGRQAGIYWHLLGCCSCFNAGPESRGNVGRRNARRGQPRTCKCSLQRRPPDSLERFRAPSPSGIGCIRSTRWACSRQVQQREGQRPGAWNVPCASALAASSDPHSQKYRSPRTRGWDGTQGAGCNRSVTQ